MSLLPGTEVSARGLRWEVVHVESLGMQSRYRLRGLEAAIQAQEIDLISPFEDVDPIIHDFQPERAAPLSNWLVYHQAFLLEQALGPNALLSVQPGRLQIQPYQLVPVIRAIRMSRVRLMLADGVGLGKTVQAGLVLTELMARRIAHRVLIVSPAGPLLEQWKTEMLERFGLRLDQIDRARFEEIRRSQELGANPFDHAGLAIASVDFLKQERVLDQLERAVYDVIVLDEAHHCMDLGASEDRDDSLRRRLALVLARQCDTLLLLSATPHDGHDRSFASLCELLDPSLVDARGNLRGERFRPHVVRRLKNHVKDPATGQALFKDRVVIPRSVRVTARDHDKFITLQKDLLELIAPELRRAFRNRRFTDVLSFISLLKRSVSTVAACKNTLAVVAERFSGLMREAAEGQDSRRQRLNTLRDYRRKLERFGTASQEEEQEIHLLETEDLAQQLITLEREVRSGSRTLTKRATVVEALDALVELAEEAQQQDPKLEQLKTEIEAIRAEEPAANVLVYTEYTDSQKAAKEYLEQAGVRTILIMSGEAADKDRKEITDRFRTQEGLILISTDAAAEGLNLHQRCHHLIHMELPFNPNRLEQRNGRIDRYGQQLQPVVRYLFLQKTFEERILWRLIRKYERQRKSLTFVPNTLGVTASSDFFNDRLLGGILQTEAQLFEDDGPQLELVSGDEEAGADPATKELLEEIERSLKGFERAAKTHSWLGEAGSNAEEQLLEEADKARDSGDKAGSVELAAFVRDAILLDGGSVEGRLEDPVFVVQLPPTWTYGLDDLPGYDGSARRVRLTTRVDLTRDESGHSVGFLGRAHPLVRRALDRVRNVSFGGDARRGQDSRISVVKGPVGVPTLLYTFLGRVASRAGREFERVVAVAWPQRGEARVYLSADEWMPLADQRRAVATADVWEKRFAAWADGTSERARQAAAVQFGPLAEEFSTERLRTLRTERENQLRWLRERVNDIVAGAEASAPDTPGLFDSQASAAVADAPRWQTIEEPEGKLAAFASDTNQPPAKRSEAEGVLRLHRNRLKDLDAHCDLGAAELVPLGMLMIVPEGSHGA